LLAFGFSSVRLDARGGTILRSRLPRSDKTFSESAQLAAESSLWPARGHESGEKRAKRPGWAVRRPLTEGLTESRGLEGLRVATLRAWRGVGENLGCTDHAGTVGSGSAFGATMSSLGDPRTAGRAAHEHRLVGLLRGCLHRLCSRLHLDLPRLAPRHRRCGGRLGSGRVVFGFLPTSNGPDDRRSRNLGLVVRQFKSTRTARCLSRKRVAAVWTLPVAQDRILCARNAGAADTIRSCAETALEQRWADLGPCATRRRGAGGLTEGERSKC